MTVTDKMDLVYVGILATSIQDHGFVVMIDAIDVHQQFKFRTMFTFQALVWRKEMTLQLFPFLRGDKAANNSVVQFP